MQKAPSIPSTSSIQAEGILRALCWESAPLCGLQDSESPFHATDLARGLVQLGQAIWETQGSPNGLDSTDTDYLQFLCLVERLAFVVLVNRVIGIVTFPGEGFLGPHVFAKKERQMEAAELRQWQDHHPNLCYSTTGNAPEHCRM